ncbi:MAG: DUF6266 family protein [Paludibacter sp.]
MAKFNSTTFGTISGRHGSAVAATTKEGKSYLRVYRAPSDPKTDKQVAQRSKFAFANSSLSCFRNLFRETFNHRRGLNMGISYALKNAITGDYPDFTIDYSKLVFTVGNVNQALTVSANHTDNKVTINWDFVDASQSKPDDNVSFIFFNEDTQLSIHMKDVCLRAEKTTEIELPDAWKGSEVYCWLYISATNNSMITNYSASQFVDTLQL